MIACGRLRVVEPAAATDRAAAGSLEWWNS